MSTFFLSILFLNSIGQIWSTPKISSGVAFRFLPWTTVDGRENRTLGLFSFFDFDNRARLFIDLEEKLPGNNNLLFVLSNYISVEKVLIFSQYYDPNRPNISNFVLERVKRDHILDLINEFGKKKRKLKLVAGIGMGIMNCNTKKNFFDNSFGGSDITSSQRVFASRIIFGVRREKLKWLFALHSIGSTNYQYPRLWLESKFSYTIDPFKKKK